MAIDRSNPIFLAPKDGGPRPELMLSAVLHLMSHYTASAAEQGALPELAPVLRATCQQLSEQWAGVVESTLPGPDKSNFLARIIGRGRAAESAQ